MTVSGTLPASMVMGVRSEEDSRAMLWPWLARITQSAGSSELRSGGVFKDGLGFIEKRCLALSETAVRMSSKVIWIDFNRGHFICRLILISSP